MKVAINFSWLLAVVYLGSIGCESEPGLEACDIREKECQEQIYLSLQQLRGDGWDPFAPMPPVKKVTPEQYKSELARLSSASSDTESSLQDQVLKLLKLIPQESSSDKAALDTIIDNTVAFYSADDRTVTVLDRESQDLEQDTAVLLHEFVHSLQDREIGLAFIRSSSDQAFAREALIEGEATLYQYLAYLAMNDLSPARVNWDDVYDKMLDEIRQDIVGSPAPLYQLMGLKYALGGAYLTRRWLRGGNAAIRHLYGDYPSSFSAYFADYKGQTPSNPKELDCYPAVPDEWTPFIADSLGAAVVYAFMTAAGVDDNTAWGQAFYWRGDILWGYTDQAEEQVAFVWRIRFEYPGAASFFIAAVSPAEPTPTDQLRFEQVESDVVISGCTSPDVLAAWQNVARCR